MIRYTLLAALLCATPALSQTLPPVRPLGATVARSTEPMGVASTVLPLPGGKVLVNDFAKRRVLLLDSTFALLSVVADSTSSTANAYGGRNGGLLPWRGDSALFVDPSSMPPLLRTIAEWNPMSALTQAVRELFGNTNPMMPTPDVWPLQNPILASLLWTALMLIVFVPLAIHRYQKAVSR